MYPRYRSALLAAAGLCFVLMSLGSFVRAADAGLACPDWPLCFDQPIPHFDTKIFLEWFHRLVAGVFSMILIGSWAYALSRPALRARAGLILSAAVVLLAIQIMLGALTVWELLLPSVVASHLMNAVLIFATLMWAHRRITIKPEDVPLVDRSNPLAKAAAVFTVLVFVQIWLGGMVSSNEAGLMCPDFPTCYGQWFPRVSGLVDLQLAHRYLALLVLMGAFVLHALARGRAALGRLRHFCRWAPVLVAAQISLGVYNVYYALPVWASGAHLALALALFAGAFMTAARLWVRLPATASGHHMVGSIDMEVSTVEG